MTDFRDHPPTIGELRSDKTSDASKWTPRDCLITLLREIDNGADIDALVISYRQTEDGKQRGRYYQATPDGLVTLGLLSSTARQIMKGH